MVVMNVYTKEVTDRKALRAFAGFPNKLYRNNEYYVPQLVSADMDTLTPAKNRAFEVCESKYWLAYDDKDNIVGRIAGIINHQYNAKIGQKICRFGWIDYIDSEDVTKALLEKVEEYAHEKGMDMVEGPVGFLEFDLAGILVEGFDQIPTAYGKYNAPYYDKLITANGYTKSVDYLEFLIDVPKDISRYKSFAEQIGKRYNLHEAVYKNKKDLIDRYIDDIFDVMNKCYSSLHSFSELSKAQCDDLKKQFVGNIQLQYVSVIVNADDRVVGFGVCLPSMSKAMQKAKGRLFPFGFMHILRALKKNDTVDALLLAILPEYRSKGVTAMIAAKIGQGFIDNNIRYIESTRELEDNQSIQNTWKNCTFRQHKRARVYKKEI